MSPKIIAIIVAGGVSLRIGGNIPKQYHVLNNGQTVLWNSLQPFLHHPDIFNVQLVLDKNGLKNQSYIYDNKLLSPVLGGESRQQSVFNGLKTIAKYCPDFVLIHDGARPFLKKELIDRVLSGLTLSNAVIPVLPITDTVVLSENKWVAQRIDRSIIKIVQTPQCFAFNLIFNLHNRYAKNDNFTDDASLCLHDGIPVLTVDGDISNKKITYTEDLKC